MIRARVKPRAVAISVAVFRGRRPREPQHIPRATRSTTGLPAPRLAFRWGSFRCASEGREKSALSRERATGVEPATSSWEAFWALAGQGFFGGGSRNGITQYSGYAVSFRQFRRPPPSGWLVFAARDRSRRPRSTVER